MTTLNKPFEYVYILQERDIARLKEHTYKIGCTKRSIVKRYSEYPNGSNMLSWWTVTDCFKVEQQIKQIFKSKFKHMSTYGEEYFNGNLADMIQTIADIVDNFDDTIDTVQPNGGAYSIIAHGNEDIDMLTDKYCDRISCMIVDALMKPYKPDSNDESRLAKLIINIIKLLYCNEQTPEYINIKCSNIATDFNEIYDGTKFVKDVMTKDIRNRTIIQKIFNLIQKVKNKRLTLYDMIEQNINPHIVTCYHYNIYDEYMQQIWVKNNTFIEASKHKQILLYDNKINCNEYITQFNDYFRNDNIMMQYYDIHKCLKEYKKMETKYNQLRFKKEKEKNGCKLLLTKLNYNYRERPNYDDSSE